jgi:hypothetical protein
MFIYLYLALRKWKSDDLTWWGLAAIGSSQDKTTEDDPLIPLLLGVLCKNWRILRILGEGRQHGPINLSTIPTNIVILTPLFTESSAINMVDQLSLINPFA